MPTYEYHCDACESEFEVEKRMSDPVEAGCPACGSDHTHRLISHSSFVLKGSGWYVTDYARKNGGNGGNGGAHGKPVTDAKKNAGHDGPKNGGSDGQPALATAPTPAPAAPATAAPAPSAPAAASTSTSP